MSSIPFLPRDRQRLLSGLAIAGATVLLVGATFAPLRIWSNLLVATFYLLTIGLGGAVFVALTYVTGGTWQVAFRRIPEAMAKTLPVAGAAMLLVLALRVHEYGWHHHGEGDVGTFWFKQFWLTPSFWLTRAVVYIGLWVLLSSWLVARSRRQDQSSALAMTSPRPRRKVAWVNLRSPRTTR